MATRHWFGGALVAAVAALSVSIGVQATESIADAAMRGDRADVLAMIKKGADVNAPQGDGVTALHWAARHGDAELVTALVAAGANARAGTQFGAYTPLHIAAERDRRRSSRRSSLQARSSTPDGDRRDAVAAAAGDPPVAALIDSRERQRDGKRSPADAAHPLPPTTASTRSSCSRAARSTPPPG
jgi:hypothetical protein